MRLQVGQFFKFYHKSFIVSAETNCKFFVVKVPRKLEIKENFFGFRKVPAEQTTKAFLVCRRKFQYLIWEKMNRWLCYSSTVASKTLREEDLLRKIGKTTKTINQSNKVKFFGSFLENWTNKKNWSLKKLTAALTIVTGQVWGGRYMLFQN